MALAEISYPTDGINNTYAVPFPYVNKSHIKVTLNDVPVAVSWPNNSTVQIDPVPSIGLVVKIVRETPIDNRLVDFQDAVVLTEPVLDKDSNQLFYLIQEAKDTLDNLVVDSVGQVILDQVTGDAISGVLTDPSFIQVQNDAAQAILDAATADGKAEAAQNAVNSKITTFYQAEPPTAEGVGDLWIDTNDGNKVYRWDVSLAWLEVRDAGIQDALDDAFTAQETADGKVVTFFTASQPTAEGVGDLWIDSSDKNKLYRWNNSIWELVRDTDITQAINDSATASQDASNAIITASQAGDDAAAALAAVSSKITTFFVPNAPIAEGEGDLWLDTANGNKLHRWNNSEWVEVTDTDLALAISKADNAQYTADGKIVSFLQDEPPTAGAIGDFWIDTNDGNKLYRWNNTDWELVRDVDIDTAIANASQAVADATAALNSANLAQATADGKVVTFYQDASPVMTDNPRTNKQPWSQDFSNAVWTASGDLTIDSTDSITAPDGSLTADQVSWGVDGLRNAGLLGNVVNGYQPSTNYVASVYVKVPSGTSNFIIRANISGMGLVDSPTLTATTSWQRFELAFTTAPGTTWVRFYPIWDDLTSPEAASTFHLWQAQVELGTKATYPIKTTTGAVTHYGGIGDLWVDTNDENKLYRFDGISWVAVQDGQIGTALQAAADAQAAADGKVVTFYQGTTPVAEGDGDLWVDQSDENKLYRWDEAGSTWVLVRDTAITQAASDAATALVQSQNALDGLDGKITTFFDVSPPTAEANGDLWVDTGNGNKLYRWDSVGMAWEDAQDVGIQTALDNAQLAKDTADGKIVTFYDTTPPVGASLGDLWIDTGNGNLLHRWDNAWISVRDAGIQQAVDDAASAILTASGAEAVANDAYALADGKVTTFFLPTQPTAEGIGDLWIDTSNNNILKRWNGSSWEEVQDAQIGQAITLATTAKDIADGKIVSFYQGAQPLATSIGDFWINTNENNKLYRWNNSVWEPVRDGDIDVALDNSLQAILDADSALTTAQQAEMKADGKVVTFVGPTEPSATAIGDLWIDTSDDNKLHRWNNTIWEELADARVQVALDNAQFAQDTADGKIVTFYSGTPPTATAVGDLWVDTSDDNHPYRWDETLSWVSIRDASIATAQQAASDAITAAAVADGKAVAAQETADGKIVTFFDNVQPTADGVGDLWIDTANDNILKRWNGTIWEEVQDAQIQQAILAAGDAQSTADGKIVSYYQSTQPVGDAIGDLWTNTDTGELKRWNGSSWVLIPQWRTYHQATAPTSPNVGDVWYDSANNNRSYQYDGSVWQPLVTTIDGSLIVNGTIVGDHINANEIGANHISVGSLSAINTNLGSIIAGSLTLTNAGTHRLEVSSDDVYPLWYGVGAKNDANGVLYVKDNGDAVFKGTLSAADGVFSGDLSGSGGTFAGSLSAASGTFDGVLTATAVNAVDTINIAGNAVTLPVSSYTEGVKDFPNPPNTGWNILQSITIDTGGSPLFLSFSAYYDVGDFADGQTKIRIRCSDGNYPYGGTSGVGVHEPLSSGKATGLLSGSCGYTPSSGTKTYFFEVLSSSSSYSRFSSSSLYGVATKR